MTTTSRQPPHARQTPQGEPERQPAELHPAAGQAKSAALASLERLAAPMLSQHHAEADLAAQAKLLKGVMDEEMQLKGMPAGRPREERAGALQNF